MSEKGILYVVSTPIGNLQDLSFRALQVLQQVSEISTEDTRHSSKLLKHFGVKTPCFSLHDHNESRVVPAVVEKLKKGQCIALISDAGTPLISDPGYLLVKGAVAAGIDVVSVPGPCALIAALSISGLSADRFVFEGFLPPKSGQRLKKLETLKRESRTILFYESCHRVVESVADMKKVFGGQRKAVVAREVTKLYEDVARDSLDGLCCLMAGDQRFQKGEYVILVEGFQQDEEQAWLEAVKTLGVLMSELSIRQASKLTSQLTGISKKRLYQYALENKNTVEPN